MTSNKMISVMIFYESCDALDTEVLMSQIRWARKGGMQVITNTG